MLSVSHIVNAVFTSRTYVLHEAGSAACWLVDCGDVPPLVDVLSSMGGSSFVVKGVLLTHAHYDHIYGLPQLTEMFPQVKVYTNAAGRAALANERLNMSRYHGDPINYTSDLVMECDEGTVIELFEGVTATVHCTPGHHPSCLTFAVGAYLFTGDAFIPGVAVVTTLPGADKRLAAQSVARIQQLAAGRVICPGHEVGQDGGAGDSQPL